MPPSPPPLGVAIIGLSASAATSWAADAHLPGLLTPAGRSRFRIVALCNSSVPAAEAAIRAFGLPPGETRAYGTPEDLAADPEVELVLCNTRVDKHLVTALPSVRAGKGVYVEWPVASTLEDVEGLVEAARGSGARVLVGLQGRWAPPVVRLRELLAEGAVGRLLSCEVRAYGGSRDRDVLPVGLKYFAQREVGGNPITIGVGHVIDFVQSVVGELVPDSVHTHFQLQRPDIPIRDPARNDEIVETIQSDVPDLLSLHGFTSPPYLPTSDDGTATTNRTANQATLTFTFRRGPPFPGTPSLVWTLSGTTGEIRLVAPAGISLHADSAYEGAPVTIQLHRFADDKVEDVAWGWSEQQLELPIRARGVSSCLYAWADYKRGGKREEKKDQGWVDLEDAAGRARQIWGWLDGWRG